MTLSKNEERRLEKKILTQSDILYFRRQYGKRFIRALRSVEEGRVFRYDFFPSDTKTWIVKGKRNEYVVIPETFCTCRDFYQAVVIAREATMCYHIMATTIAKVRDSFSIIKSNDTARRSFFARWRKIK
ncbi:MAG: hypothetical protein BAJATHORv1_20339 [Candidatus Thorarchaeota archaeon]|nr:MAG: hypothetical protein BAJATHORv1_20339 [Candidatus Thorarchaeota archaeon]